MTAPARFDLVGAGSPILDLVAPVPESFLRKAGGAKGGSSLVDDAEMGGLLARLPAPPLRTTGGSAANTVFNAARLGLRATYVGKLGRDEAAEAYLERYRSAGVDVGRFKRGTVPTGICLALITPDGERSQRVSLGAAQTLGPEEISAADFRDCRHAHVEGYLAFHPPLCGAVLDRAREAGATVSLDLASFELVESARDWLLGRLGRGIDIVFANEDEIRALLPGRGGDFAALARELAAFGPIAAVKMGREGAWIARGETLHRIAPVPVSDLKDTLGAGDAWAAGFLAGHLRGLPLPQCGALGSLLGAETVRHAGTLIPAEAWTDVRRQADAILAAPQAG